ncbi:MAG TPA: hypothetical protein VFS24_16330 [Steroidobacteraceae bacterium]|nr:hypothetical protein [Steroidobacteraceae bacterium]
MGIQQQISLLRETLKSHGIAETVRVGWCGLRYKGQTRKILFAIAEPQPLPDAMKAAAEHVFKFASPEDLAALAPDPTNSIAPIDIERVRNGISRCMLQMDGETLVGYAWIWTNRLAYIDDGVHLNLPNDTIYNYKGYTNPKYRGKSFQALRHLNLLKLTAPEGVKRLFGFVDHFNSKSLKGVRKSGYVPVGELRIKHKNGRVRLTVDVQEHFWSAEART